MYEVYDKEGVLCAEIGEGASINKSVLEKAGLFVLHRLDTFDLRMACINEIEKRIQREAV